MINKNIAQDQSRIAGIKPEREHSPADCVDLSLQGALRRNNLHRVVRADPVGVCFVAALLAKVCPITLGGMRRAVCAG